MMLLLLLAVLFMSALLALFSSRKSSLWPKVFSYGGLVSAGAILLLILQTVDRAAFDFYWLEWKTPWISAWEINFHLGVDGLSFWLSLLTLLMGALALIFAPQRNSSCAAIMLATFGTVGVLLAADTFLFFIFWEISLLPIYWMTMVHGTEERSSTTIRFIIYTQTSGLILLLSVLALSYAHFVATGMLTFDYRQLLNEVKAEEIELFLLLGFIIAFLIKLPAFGFHGWIKPIFATAPISILLVSVLVKTAAYGLMRFSWPMFPMGSYAVSSTMIIIGCITALYGAVVALYQNHPKHILAYGTMSHAGLILAGIFCQSSASFHGVFLLLITQSLSTGGLLLLLGHLYRHVSVADLTNFGGLFSRMPYFSVIFLGFILAGIGFPTFGNFVGEWLVLWAAFIEKPFFAVVLSVAIFLGVIYSLWFFQRLIFRKQAVPASDVMDLSTRESFVFSMMLIALLSLGLWPSLILNFVTPKTATLNVQQEPSLSFAQVKAP